jgi:hypothetical protein
MFRYHAVAMHVYWLLWIFKQWYLSNDNPIAPNILMEKYNE